MSRRASGKRIGQASRYLNGGANALVRRPPNPGENLQQVGEWPRERLLKMDAQFCAAMERAIARGLEHRSSASERATWRGRFGTSKLTWPLWTS
jgi:hypothetical protein